MKSTVFVRPNLKMFLLGATLLVVVQHLITDGQSQAQAPGQLLPLSVAARELSEDEVQSLIRLATEKPSADIYIRISQCYEKRGDYRRALLFLRRAEKIGQIDDASD